MENSSTADTTSPLQAGTTSTFRHQYAFAALLVLILSIGILVRTSHFPNLPPGVNQDEAASAYEAFSLAETGHDKWGNALPAYFPAWGSGQNVLLAYLTVPAIKVCGLSVFSARLPMLVFGLLALPLLFYCLRPLGRVAALLGTFLLAVAPWHFMLSRWGLESNLVPFFMLLGCTTLSQALITQRRRWILPSLLPFALSLYAYGTTVAVLPVLLGAVAVLAFRQWRGQWRSWLVAAALFLLVATPFLIFFVENYVLHQNLAWTDSLFFSTPLLPATRISQMSSDWGATMQHNLDFMWAGFDDGTCYNVLPGFKPLPGLVLPLTVLALLVGVYRRFGQQRRLFGTPPVAVLSVFMLWGVASLALFLSFELNINRFNHFFLPCIVLAAWVLPMVVNSFKPDVPRQRLLVWTGAIVLLLLETAPAIRNYFTEYRSGPIKDQFNSGMEEAFQVVEGLWGVKQVRITTQMPLPYVYALFFLRYPPAQFQREADVSIDGDTYNVKGFGRYVFTDEHLDQQQQYGYLSRKNEFADTDQRHRQVMFTNDGWEVGIMQPGPR